MRAQDLPPPLEAAVQEQIKCYLTLRGWFCSNIKERYFRQGSGQYSEPGIPDMLCIKAGRVVMLEVKRPDCSYAKKPRKSQHIWHAEWRRQGGEVYVVRSVEDAAMHCDSEAKNEAHF